MEICGFSVGRCTTHRECTVEQSIHCSEQQSISISIDNESNAWICCASALMKTIPVIRRHLPSEQLLQFSSSKCGNWVYTFSLIFGSMYLLCWNISFIFFLSVYLSFIQSINRWANFFLIKKEHTFILVLLAMFQLQFSSPPRYRWWVLSKCLLNDCVIATDGPTW